MNSMKVLSIIFFWIASLILGVFILALKLKVDPYLVQHDNIILIVSACLILVFLVIGVVVGSKKEKVKFSPKMGGEEE